MKSADILLINSLAPRQRSISDTSLENSLIMLRTYLSEKGFNVEVLDYQRLHYLDNGIPKWCLVYLKHLVNLQMKLLSKGIKLLALPVMFANMPVQSYALKKKELFMNQLIHEIVSQIKTQGINLVGIKVWYGDSFKWSKLITKKIKEECPETVVIAGGPQVNVYKEAVLNDSEFDLAVMGAGEQVLEKLLSMRKTAKSKKEFLDTLFKENNNSRFIRGSIHVSETTIPDYTSHDLEGKIRLHPIIEGVGCPWNKCHFCSHTIIQEQYHPRPIEQITNEIKIMVGKGIRLFRFTGSDTPISHGKKIAEGILSHGLEIKYSMFTRPAKMTDERLKAFEVMIESGLKAVFIGGETGHDLINDKVMNKGVSRKEIIETIEGIKLASKNVGKPCYIGLALIHPCPTLHHVSLEEVYLENLSLIKNSMPDTVLISPPAPFPGTAWFEEAPKYGFQMGKGFIFSLMNYEYALYKPPELWEKMDISLEGLSSNELLKETGRLRRSIMELGIPTDITDEYFMMAEAVGCKNKADLNRFKLNTLVDIVSGTTDYTKEIAKKINEVF